jgi:hypothetical protein
MLYKVSARQKKKKKKIRKEKEIKINYERRRDNIYWILCLLNVYRYRERQREKGSKEKGVDIYFILSSIMKRYFFLHPKKREPNMKTEEKVSFLHEI